MKVKNYRKVISFLNFDLDDEIEKVLTKVGNDIYNDSQSAVHVQTSALKGSGKVNVIRDGDKFTVNVGYDESYAPFEEFGGGSRFKVIDPEFTEYARTFYVDGTGRNYAHPFLTPAYRKNRMKAVEELIKHLNDKSR